MSPLSTLARDLVERRLWPVAAVLVVALIAVPVVFLHSTPAAVAPAAPAAPAAAAPAPAAATPAPTTTNADPMSDPAVALTSSPFAAAFGSGLSLPPSMEGLLKSTKGADDRKTVADAPLRDPFAAAASAASASASTASAASPGSAATDPVAGAASASASASTSAPAPSSGGATAVPAGPSSPESAASTRHADVTPAPATTPAPAAAPAGDSSSASDSDSSAVFHADVRFGTTATSPMVKDARRLTAFPSSYQPVAVFLGVMRGGWGAAFAIRTGSEPKNAPSCRPRKQICTWVILHPGESVTLNATDPATGVATPYTLKLEKVRKTVDTAAAAREAARRASLAGRCLLGPLAAYKYDTNTGTLAPRPELKACRYSTPGQPQGAAVRVAHIG